MTITQRTGGRAYAEYLLSARQEFQRGQAATVEQIQDVYRRAADGLARDIAEASPDSLRHAHLTALQQKLDRRVREMNQETLAAVHQGIWRSSAAGSSVVAGVTAAQMQGVVAKAAVDSLFAGINERATLAMLARTRRDGLMLSDRVWRCGESARQSVTTIIEDAVARGQSAKTTARLVQQYMQPNIWTAHKLETRRRLGVSKDVSYQAMRLARTEMNNAFLEGMVAANQHSPGYRGIYWRLSPQHAIFDICTDMSNDLSHGEPGFYPKGEEPVRPHPQCVLGGTVVSGPRVVGSATRWYEGEIVEMQTASGHNLAVTPNHPILTPQGWVAAGQLNIGGYIVCRSGEQGDAPLLAAALHDPDDYQVPSLVEDVARSLGEAQGMATARVPTTAKDFHGDGGGSEVCVIRAYGFLRDCGDTAFAEPCLKSPFLLRDPERTGLAGLGKPTPMLKGMGNAFGSCMGSLGVAPVILGGKLCVNQGLGFLERAAGNPVRFENAPYGLSFDAVPLRQGLFRDAAQIGLNEPVSIRRLPGALGVGKRHNLHLRSGRNPLSAQHSENGIAGTESVPSRESLRRFAGKVALDQIAGITRLPRFAGHVYNLQTTDGWYVANGIITHNCMCAPVPAYIPPREMVANLRQWRNDPASQPELERWHQEVRRAGDVSTIAVAQAIAITSPEFASTLRDNLATVWDSEERLRLFDSKMADAIQAHLEGGGTIYDLLDGFQPGDQPALLSKEYFEAISEPDARTSPIEQNALGNAADWLRHNVHPEVAGQAGAVRQIKGDSARGYYGIKSRVLAWDGKSPDAFVHEYGHHLQEQGSQTAKDMIGAFMRERTAGERLTEIYPGSNELGYRDKFLDPYMGKTYGTQGQPEGREILSVGMQIMYNEPDRLYKQDPGCFRLVYAILRGVFS